MKKGPLIFAAILIIFSASPALAETAREFFQKGEEAYHAGNYEEAIRLYEKCVELDQNFASVFNSLGLAHQAMGENMSNTVWFFKTAVQIDPDYAEAYANMCKVYYEHQEFSSAEPACVRALEISPGMVSAQLTLAWVYLMGKKDGEKAAYYFSEVRKRVKNPVIEYGLGMAYSMSGERAKVLDIVTKLRASGENKLAENLERTIRLYDSPEVVPQRLPIPQEQKSTLVSTEPETGQPEQAAPPANIGQMTIRLRGRLTSETSGDEGPPPETAPSEYGEQGQQKSAADRIRELREIRRATRIRATGTTY